MGKSKLGSTIIGIWLLLFFAVFACCIPKVSDDWTAIYRSSPDGLFAFLINSISKTWNSSSGDGRVIGNLMIHISVNISIVRILYWICAMSVLVLFMSKLSQSNAKRWWWACLPVLLIFLSPKAWFAGDISWTCGFTNYISPFAILLVCLYQLRNVFYDKPMEDTWPAGILCLILGLCGQLFSEIITFYVSIVSVGFVVWHWIRFKKASRTTILYCIGALLGAFIMSRSPAYAGYVAQEVQEYVYLRAVGLSSLDKMLRIFRTVYDQVSAYSLEANLAPVALISVSALCLLNRSEKKGRFLPVAATVILAAVPVYFLINARDLVNPEELVSLLPFGEVLGGDLPAILLDMALYALYILSVVYTLLTCVKDIYCKSFGCFLVFSFLLCTAPLCVTYPLSHRVFCSAYLFLALLGLLMLNTLLAECAQKCIVPVTAVLSATAMVCLLYLAMFSMNPRIERQKISYIEYCMERHDTTIVIPEFPYGQRLYLPYSTPNCVYYYEEENDIAYELMPYKTWLQEYYLPTGLK